MIYDAFRKSISKLSLATPNWLLPAAGERLTGGRVKFADWAELYLAARFIFAFALAFLLPQVGVLVWLVAVIQVGSFLYLLKIVFPVGERGLKDPSRSLFFALGHYIEIGLSAAYVYWALELLKTSSSGPLSRLDHVYFSFVALTTIGFGDIVPAGPAGQLLLIFQSIVGLFMLATVVGLFLSLSASAGRVGEP